MKLKIFVISLICMMFIPFSVHAEDAMFNITAVTSGDTTTITIENNSGLNPIYVSTLLLSNGDRVPVHADVPESSIVQIPAREIPGITSAKCLPVPGTFEGWEQFMSNPDDPSDGMFDLTVDFIQY